MFNLVYKSIADPIMGQIQIQDMLENARKYNTKNNITGCLLYYNGEFLQYLEGYQVKVLSLFDRIKKDSRHSEVILLSHSYIYTREFDNWNMAYENFLGNNDQLQYLKLLVGSYMETPNAAMEPNPTSKSFWNAAKKLIENKSIQKLN